jgi:hypothetical protein
MTTSSTSSRSKTSARRPATKSRRLLKVLARVGRTYLALY